MTYAEWLDPCRYRFLCGEKDAGPIQSEGEHRCTGCNRVFKRLSLCPLHEYPLLKETVVTAEERAAAEAQIAVLKVKIGEAMREREESNKRETGFREVMLEKERKMRGEIHQLRLRSREKSQFAILCGLIEAEFGHEICNRLVMKSIGLYEAQGIQEPKP